jgi:uncharacterized protein (TIGR00369 family)
MRDRVVPLPAAPLNLHHLLRMNDTFTPAGATERHIPFLAWLGARLERVSGGEAVVVVDLLAELLNNHGGGHGGVLMTLLDNAMANAALSRIAFTREVVTVDIHVAFMRPATGRLIATGRAIGGGRSVCFCEADVADASGQVVARAMGTFRYRALGGVPVDGERGAR